MTGDERLYMEAACDYLKGKGFKNVLVICSPSANGKGTASYQANCATGKDALTLAGWFMDNCMERFAKKGSVLYRFWKIFLHNLSVELINFNGVGKVGADDSTPHAEVIPFHSFPKD